MPAGDAQQRQRIRASDAKAGSRLGNQRMRQPGLGDRACGPAPTPEPPVPVAECSLPDARPVRIERSDGEKRPLYLPGGRMLEIRN